MTEPPKDPFDLENGNVDMNEHLKMEYNSSEDLAQALRLTVEYVGNDLLPAQKGWDWFDALKRYDPKMVQPFLEEPVHSSRSDDSTDPVLFTGLQPPNTLTEVIGQGIGAGSVCWTNMNKAGVFKSVRAATIMNEMVAWIENNYTLKSTNDDTLGPYTTIGPEAFTSGDVISYKGENYYRACNEFVADNPDGGSSFCVKRVDHPGKFHEAYDGKTREK